MAMAMTLRKTHPISERLHYIPEKKKKKKKWSKSAFLLAASAKKPVFDLFKN